MFTGPRKGVTIPTRPPAIVAMIVVKASGAAIPAKSIQVHARTPITR